MSKEQNQHSDLTKWVKRAAWVLGSLLLLILIVRFSLKTSYVQNRVKGFIVSAANAKLNGKLTIDKLSGDLWDELSISGLTLTAEDTLAHVDSIYISFNIWSLLNDQFEVSELKIYSPAVNLEQRHGQWNVQNLVVRSDTASGSFPFQIDDFVVSHGAVSVQSDSLPAESYFTVNELDINSNLSLGPDVFSFNLHNLSFQIEQTQLDAPLRVETSAHADSNSITLEKLVLATGNSMIRSSAYAGKKDSTVRLDLSASPIAWRDIAEYANDFPVNENLQVDLGVSGTLPEFTVTLDIHSKGLRSLEMSSQFLWQQDLSLQELNIQADYIDPAILLSDTSLPKVENLDFKFMGKVDFSDFPKSHGNAHLSTGKISSSPYEIDALSATLDLKDASALIHVETRHREQSLNSDISIQQLWTDLPETKIDVQGSNIKPAYWAQDTTLRGNLTFEAELKGQGFYPDSTLWDYSLMMNGSLMDQPISKFTANGKISREMATVNSRLRVRGSMVNLAASIKNLSTVPDYSYSLESEAIDLGSLFEAENFATAINAKISGQGHGFDPATMRLQSAIKIDTSLINGELIKNLSADISIRDTIAVVDSARLQSTMAEGSFSARINLLRLYSPDNELLLKLRLKDLNSLAPLFNAERLQARGTISGKLYPEESEKLQFIGSIDFSEVTYNELFSASGADGSFELEIKKNLEYSVDLKLSAPVFSGLQLQDLVFMSRGISTDSLITGNLELQFSSPNEGKIEHGGTFSYSQDSILVHTVKLNIESNLRTLRLQNPFNLLVVGDTLRMDTMRVAAGREAFLEVAAPLITPDIQKVYVRAEALNTTVIQNAVLGEPYFKGILSGQLRASRVDTAIEAQGHLLFTDLTYRDINFDSLFVQTQVDNERLTSTVSVLYEGNKLIEGEASLPFKLGDPEKLPPSFFEQPISGEIKINDISLERFKPLIEEAGLSNTTGIFSFIGTLNGTAGHPEFSADVRLYDAILSGVPVDSITAGIAYHHSLSQLDLNALVISMKQKAAEVEAKVPLFVNMKTFNIDLPQEGDSVSVDIEINDFNLAALNDFLDEQTAREVEGKLNGTVYIGGPLGNLKTDGKLMIQKGAFRLVPVDIRVDNIQTIVRLMPEQIQLDKFFAKSGSGELRAQGTVGLVELEPGKIDFKVEADNFTAANTSQYSAIIDMDARAQGSFTKPKVSGSLSFLSGYIQLDNFGEKAVENVELDSLDQEEDSLSIYDSLSMNMNISFDHRFFIRNERYLELEIEIEGLLDLVKEMDNDMQLFGSLSAVDGYALPLGKRFELEEGAVTFSGDPANPALSIRTRYEPPQPEEEIIIWYIIEGTVESPKFKYESQPPMELENILSYTLFGKPFYALDSWKQVVAGSGGGNTTAADVALDILLDRVETLATQKLGIDVVKIESTSVGGENGTAITTGWYLNPKVFFAIQNIVTGSTPDTSFLLEYMLQDNLELILRQGNGIRQGIDIRWEYDY